MLQASVVLATYNRNAALSRLLADLAEQTAPREQFEVVIVDDGSREDPTPVVTPFSAAIQVSLIRQRNSGVAIARQRGVLKARGRIVIFLDDDMRVPRNFVAEHVWAHEAHDDHVVMGELLPDEKLPDMPLFERFFAYQLEKAACRHAAKGTFAGHEVYTGNLSLPRELFLRAGGFDPAFFIEDTELGVRLEQIGARFVFSREAAAVHASDHTSLEGWLDRCYREGRDWVRLARKHPWAHAASPWSFFAKANPIARPFFAAAVLAPGVAPTLARAVVRGAIGADALGSERGIGAFMTLVYGIGYYRGVRKECGSLRDAYAAYRAYVRQEEQLRAAADAGDRNLADDDERPSGGRLRGPEARAAMMGIGIDDLSTITPA